ncbi:PepSY domain-containing protein [Bacillus sp. MMSF_3328]|uniref:PepSY domain-containing protein n=1 Tax=Bacillus sp. MMSF_3328 TaxID=3047080 RepID=UPI00273D6E1E|nr:PepSY domain-containing protein [Bacillus sp. MMSF_3328]
MKEVLMKYKKWILGFAGVFAAAVIGVGIYFAAEKMGEITQKEAEALMRDNDGEVLSFAREWDWEFGSPSTIEMAVKTEGSYEEIEMDASNGEILRREKKYLEASANSPVSVESAAAASTAPGITPEEAIKLALEEVKGNVKEIELDDEERRLIYELEIEEGKREYNVHIDAMTGSVLMVSTES